MILDVHAVVMGLGQAISLEAGEGSLLSWHLGDDEDARDGLLTALSSPNINNLIFYLPWVTTNCDCEEQK